MRTWLYYTLLRCDLLTGVAPWREAWIMGYGLDERGLKMSKSRGNSIDPYPVIRKYGADAFRLWSASEVNHGYDFRCNEQKIDSMRKFLSKLWNISRLLSEFPVPEASVRTTPAPADEWILGELDTLIKRCREGYAEYNFFIPATAVREFTWNVFAAHYVEMVKRRARRDGFGEAEGAAAVQTLHVVLSAILRLLAPIIPFMTDYLWRKMYSEESVHLQRHPEPRGAATDTTAAEVASFNSEVWNKKKAAGLSLKDPISVEIPPRLLPMAADLRAMHNIDG